VLQVHALPFADPCKQVRWRSRAALTGWYKTAR